VTVRTGVWLFPDAPPAELVEAAVAMEAAGLDELWLGDEGPARDPFAVLAAIAVRTERLRLGIGVTNPYLRHPALTAATAATIDELSAGRMILGLGAGGSIALDPVGIQPTRPLADCRAAFDVIRAVLDGRAVAGYAPPAHAVKAPDLPIVIGARSERFNRWASSVADGAFLAGIPPTFQAEAAGWARSVRAIPLHSYVSACLNDDERERTRPRLIHAFSDAPEQLRARAGLRLDEVREAARALDAGDEEPARRLLTDERLDLVLVGQASVVPVLVGLARELGPASVGVALLGEDPIGQVTRAAALLAHVRNELA
jgi:5,10-methylenetetrahydromethanopterin reductase